MTSQKQRTAEKAKLAAGTPAPEPQAIAVLHAAVLKEAIAGRFLEALSTCQQALDLDPDNADTMHLMGVVNLEAGQVEHAVAWTSRAIGKEPKPAFLTTLGLAFSALGRHDDAVMAFDTAVQIKPDDAQLWWQKGNALVTMGRTSEALICFAQTLRLDPRHGDAAYKCGHILHGLGRFEEALVHLDRSAELQRDHAPTLQMRAVVCKELNRLDEALADNQRAVALDPANADACGNMGAILQAQGRIEDALSWYDRALQLNPNVARIVTNRAAALAELGRLGEAMATYRHALVIAPDFGEAAWNLALLQMLVGDFESGWKGREVRWKFPQLRPAYPDFRGEMWSGEQKLTGKTIVVCADEGLGDTIQYVRYLPMLTARGARVIFVVEPTLMPLLSGARGVSLCLPKLESTVLPPYDLHIPVTCLPLAFGTRVDSIPPGEAYLPSPAGERVQAFEGRVGPHDRLRVGLVWSGNPRHLNDRNRSTSLAELSGILDIDATFVSLQKDPRPQDAELLRARPGIIDLTAELKDFADTAALVSCLDLVISVDTSVAHLSAALGKPTWLLLPYMPDFRWLLGRDDSPWYPSLRLFRQSETREYGSVLDRVRGELVAKAQTHARDRAE
jgi:tetratricopeptide (TPR) repeat protein